MDETNSSEVQNEEKKEAKEVKKEKHIIMTMAQYNAVVAELAKTPAQYSYNAITIMNQLPEKELEV